MIINGLKGATPNTSVLIGCVSFIEIVVSFNKLSTLSEKIITVYNGVSAKFKVIEDEKKKLTEQYFNEGGKEEIFTCSKV